MLRAPPVLLLLLALFGLGLPPGLWGQDPDERAPVVPSKGYRLEQNYPNPPNPDTYIPFYLEEGLFKDGEPRVVTIRIVNMFRQLIAIPKAVGHPRGKDVRVQGLRYTEPGRKVAYWDGRDLNGRRAPSGLYYCELVVGDRREPDLIRIIVANPAKRSRFIPPIFRRQ
jgi:hypothetical protein